MEGSLTSAEDTIQHLLELPSGDGPVLWGRQMLKTQK